MLMFAGGAYEAGRGGRCWNARLTPACDELPSPRDGCCMASVRAGVLRSQGRSGSTLESALTRRRRRMESW